MVSVYIALKVCCVEGMNASSLVGLKVTRKSVQEKDKKNIFSLFGCHIDTAKQERALNFYLVVSDQLFSVILVTTNSKFSALCCSVASM